MKKIFHLAKKDFSGYINSPLAYTILVPFLFLTIFIYLRTALVNGEANLRPYFELLPWFLLLLVPAIAMKLLPDEQKSQTLELLFAHPLSELQIVLGKFLGALAFLGVILFATIGLPITLLVYSRPDVGQIAGQYIGALCIGATFLSMSLAASAYVKNAISSFLLGATICFVLLIIGVDFITKMLPYPVNFIASELSVVTHGNTIARGLLDIRDIFYFFTITAIFLTITVFKLSERKIAEKPREKSKLYFSLVLILGIGIIANILLSFYPVRLDLTQARLFTLSEGTKQTLTALPDIVTITLYRSRALPAHMELVARDTTDLLQDYEKLSSRIKTKVAYPEEDRNAESEVQTAGIQHMQFNSIGTEKFEVQRGLLGIMIRFGDKTESIPFVPDTSDLEYQLTRKIRKLVHEKQQIIGIIENGYAETGMFTELLKTQYQIKTIAEGESFSPRELAALIVIDNGLSESTMSAQIKTYADQGGHIVLLASGVGINKQNLNSQKSTSPILSAFKTYGVTINTDLVYDLQLSETISLDGKDGQKYLAPYPYWIRALPAATDFPPLTAVKSIGLGWVSSLRLESKQGIQQKTLLTTGSHAGREKDNFNILPQNVTSLTPNATYLPLAVSLEKGNTRVVIVGTDTLVQDQFLQNNRDNVAFLANTIDYLAAEKDLAAIPSKTAGKQIFAFRSPLDVHIVQYGNLLLPPLMVILFAVYHLRKRNIRARKIYGK